MRRRLKNELQLFRSAWMQVETFLDRIDDARDQDSWYDLRCRALAAAAEAVEGNRLRLYGYRLLPAAWDTPDNVASVPDLDTRANMLPGGVEVELALTGLHTDDEGKVPTP